VVADDELHLGVFHATDAGPGHLMRLFPGRLPHPKAARKARKPDAEALTRLPPFAGCPHGALLAIGSGSKRGWMTRRMPDARTGSAIRSPVARCF